MKQYRDTQGSTTSSSWEALCYITRPKSWKSLHKSKVSLSVACKLFRDPIQAEPGLTVLASRDIRSRTRCLDDVSGFDVLLETLRIAKAEATAVLSTREHLLTNGVIALLGHVIRRAGRAITKGLPRRRVSMSSSERGGGPRRPRRADLRPKGHLRPVR